MPIVVVSDAKNSDMVALESRSMLLNVRLDHWPAAGGGLLVSAALPSLAAVVGGQSPDFHLILASSGLHSLDIAYAALPAKALHRVREIVCDELSLTEEDVDLLANRQRSPKENRISSDLLLSEWAFRAAAATAKTLLLLEAAELWGTNSYHCELRNGAIFHADRRAEISALAAGAALQVLPPSITLRCGRAIAPEAAPFRSTFVKSSQLSSKMRLPI